MKILMLFKALLKPVWKIAWKPALIAVAAYAFFIVSDYIIAFLCLFVTIAHIIAVIFATATQYKVVCHEHRMNANEQDIIAMWCLAGLVPALAFGYAQWTYLIFFPWKLLLPCTAAFACLYAMIYWKWLYRVVCNYTEGRDYRLAINGSSGTPHMPAA